MDFVFDVDSECLTECWRLKFSYIDNNCPEIKGTSINLDFPPDFLEWLASEQVGEKSRVRSNR